MRAPPSAPADMAEQRVLADIVVQPVANLPVVVAATGSRDRRRRLWVLSVMALAAVGLGAAY
jgi:hypothetical protein